MQKASQDTHCLQGPGMIRLKRPVMKLGICLLEVQLLCMKEDMILTGLDRKLPSILQVMSVMLRTLPVLRVDIRLSIVMQIQYTIQMAHGKGELIK